MPRTKNVVLKYYCACSMDFATNKQLQNHKYKYPRHNKPQEVQAGADIQDFVGFDQDIAEDFDILVSNDLGKYVFITCLYRPSNLYTKSF